MLRKRKNYLLALGFAGLLFVPALQTVGKVKAAPHWNSVHPLKRPLPQTPTSFARSRRDPRIQTVRKITAAVTAGLKRNSYKISERKFEYCEPYEDTLRRIAFDAKGIARLYVKEGGSEDSALKWQHYYDSAGRLRFVFISGGAMNGSELEHRIYFGEGGERIWEEHKYTKGPGYTFAEKWPDEELQKTDPLRAFNATSPCSEVGPRRRPKLR